MRMTPHLNLPAPSTRRPAYSVFRTWRRPVFLINSRMGRFTATPPAFGCAPEPVGFPLSRSYGVILPSSLTRVLSSALGYAPCLPVSVSGTVARRADHEDFLGDCSGHFANIIGLVVPPGMSRWICLPLPLGPHRALLIARRPFQSRLSLADNVRRAAREC